MLVDCIVDQKVFKPEVNTGPASVLSSASVKLTGLVNTNDHSAVYPFLSDVYKNHGYIVLSTAREGQINELLCFLMMVGG